MSQASGCAGVQFSKPLIDFHFPTVRNDPSWGSVLKTPDRLPNLRWERKAELGFSSQNP